MEKRTFSPEGSPEAIGPYNHGTRIGNLLFTAGQIPLDPETNKIVSDDIAIQATRVLENLRILLESEGLDLGHIVKTTIFMVDLSEFAQVNEIYAGFFSENFPSRSTVQVTALPMGARIEIEAIAHY
ncbi:Rid family detoxifying hydrolase [Verrucomicrobia bacterium]|nr:Rid family detoxifying hydrolase [Verrucomicrobiota bacterium]MDB4776999.1 Rid family detoxifying hydrolase [Verrucomicrobiota bacterium]MDB4795554.1 Rid family detoxifying hydrolase [Verrucomicrobiota bacterium]MDC0323932.1 Rid family detoxifying hydrolase [Verrucomicrobiota bacterium]